MAKVTVYYRRTPFAKIKRTQPCYHYIMQYLNIIGYTSVNQKWEQNAMKMALPAFFETFDPISQVYAFLRYQKVLMQNEHEKVRNQVIYEMSIF